MWGYLVLSRRGYLVGIVYKAGLTSSDRWFYFLEVNALHTLLKMRRRSPANASKIEVARAKEVTFKFKA